MAATGLQAMKSGGVSLNVQVPAGAIDFVFCLSAESAFSSVFHSAKSGGTASVCYHPFTKRQQFDTVVKTGTFVFQILTWSVETSVAIGQKLGKVDWTMKDAPWRDEPTELSTGIVDNENVKIDSVWVSKYRLLWHERPFASGRNTYSTVTLLARLRG